MYIYRNIIRMLYYMYFKHVRQMFSDFYFDRVQEVTTCFSLPSNALAKEELLVF